MLEAILSMSALMSVMASASFTAEESMRSVLSKIMAIKLPRNIVSKRYVLC